MLKESTDKKTKKSSVTHAEEFLYYGTTLKKSGLIFKDDGIKAKEGGSISLRSSRDEAMKAAKRYHSRYPVVLTIMSKKMEEDGFAFRRSAKGIYYCSDIPKEYIDPISLLYISNPGTVKFSLAFDIDFETMEREYQNHRKRLRDWLSDTAELCRSDSELADAVKRSIKGSILVKGDGGIHGVYNDGIKKDVLITDRSVLDAAK